MFFAYFEDRLRTLPLLCVDGVVEEGLNLSHWPGNRTPSHLKADTSTEMALKLARDPGREEWLRGVSVVTNNHFDTDGLLSVYAVLRPGEALQHEKALVRAAPAGDIGEYTTPDAFKFDAVVTACDGDPLSPFAGEIQGRPETEKYQIFYERLLAMLPGLLFETGQYKSLWKGPLASLTQGLMRMSSVARIREHDAARLTVIEAAEPLDRTARFNTARHHRVLTATRSPSGFVYDMAFQIFSWFETVTPPRGTRIDLGGLAADFDGLERDGAGRWAYTGNDSLDARLYRAGREGEPVASSLPLDLVEGRLVEFFDGRP